MQSLVAILLFVASTVDPRLVEPLQRLTAVIAHDGKQIGAEYLQIVNGSSMTLAVAELPPGRLGHYSIATRTVTISEFALAEDQRFVATVLAHELRHADDADLTALGLLTAGCVELEARAFASQASVARALWPDELPSGTDLERQLTMLVHQYEHEGVSRLRATLTQDAAYRGLCDDDAGTTDARVLLTAVRMLAAGQRISISEAIRCAREEATTLRWSKKVRNRLSTIQTRSHRFGTNSM